MPIHSAGYRPWEGRRLPGTARWGVIAITGIRRAATSRWLRRMIFLAIFPAVFLSLPFFLFEQSLRDPEMAANLAEFMGNMPQGEAFEAAVAEGLQHATPEQIESLRHAIWSYLLLTLFRYPQAILMVLVVGIVAPPLISQDVRSRAFLIYFSRPITRAEYVAGKFAVVAFFLLMITTAPALVLYFFGVLLSPSLGVIGTTWDLPLLILGASAVLILPTTAIALMFSSVTTESRYAGFAWFAIWILGHVIFNVVMGMTAAYTGVMEEPGWRVLLSPYQTLGVVQSWVFDLHTDDSVVLPALTVLAIATAASIAIVFRRVATPMRA
jgi:ABC-type transport system involved in multi-copper enzyme maturation permease subunit